jgi:phasin family protein
MPAHRNSNEKIAKLADGGPDAAEETTRTTRIVTEEAAKAGEQAMRAGVDIARRTADTARENVQSGLNTAVQGVQRATDQFTQILGFTGPRAEELARQSSENIEAVSQASTVLARGFQEVSQEWFGFAHERLTKNIEALGRFAHCRSAQDFVALQSEVARDNMQQAIETGRRLGQVSARVADEAARIVQGRANANTDRVRRVA